MVRPLHLLVPPRRHQHWRFRQRLRQLPRGEILEMLFAGMRRLLPTTLILFAPFLAAGLKLLYVRGKARRSDYPDHLAFAPPLKQCWYTLSAGFGVQKIF